MLVVALRNDGTGTNDDACYDVVVTLNEQVLYEGRVEGHDRDTGWRGLLTDLVQQSEQPPWLFEEMFPEEVWPVKEKTRG